MTDLTPFDVAGDSMRFGVTDGGRPYVVADDFAPTLGYTRARDALRMVDDEEKGAQIVRTPGGEQRMSVLYEEGIWELIFLSRRPEAKAIKARVKVVLRKLHEGELAVVDQPKFEIPKSYAEALELAAKQARDLEVAREKADAFDAFLNGKGVYLIDTVANLIGTKHKALWNLLYAEKILISKGARRRQPYALTKTQGWFEVKTHSQERTNGHAATTTYVTPYGCEQIRLLAISRDLIQPQLLALTGGA